MTDTSAEAHRRGKRRGAYARARARVLALLRRDGPLTMGEVDERMATADPHWTRRSSRLAELRALGLVASDASRRCTVTGHRALVWRAVAPGEGPPERPKRLTRRDLERERDRWRAAALRALAALRDRADSAGISRETLGP